MRALTATDVMEAELRRVADAVEEEKIALFVCRVGAEWLAIRAELVEAVTDDEGRSRVPGAPAHITGVMTHRDHVVAVVDVATLCACALDDAHGRVASSSPFASSSSFARTVIVSDGCMRAGLQVAAAAGLVECVVEAVHESAHESAHESGRESAHEPTNKSAAHGLDAFTDGWCMTPWGRARALDVAALLEAARVHA